MLHSICLSNGTTFKENNKYYAIILLHFPACYENDDEYLITTTCLFVLNTFLKININNIFIF